MCSVLGAGGRAGRSVLHLRGWEGTPLGKGSAYPELQVMLAGVSLQSKRCFLLTVVLLSPFFIHRPFQFYGLPWDLPVVPLPLTPGWFTGHNTILLFVFADARCFPGPAWKDGQILLCFHPPRSLLTFLHCGCWSEDRCMGWLGPTHGRPEYISLNRNTCFPQQRQTSIRNVLGMIMNPKGLAC